MTDANPAFDTVHPSGHILVRSCRGGYMHSVALSEEAMDTDAATLARLVSVQFVVGQLPPVQLSCDRVGWASWLKHWV